MRLTFAIAAGLLILAARSAWADEEVYVKDKEKPHKGVITQETAKGISMKAGKQNLEIPAEDIIDVAHDEVEPIAVRLNVRRARLAEKESNDASAKEATRKAKLQEALKTYEENLPLLKPDQKFAKVHLEYRIATLTARQAQETGGSMDAALAKLVAFKTKHPNSWQLTECLKLLARLQLNGKQYKEAEETYQELAEANVSDETKKEAELLAALVSVRAGKHEVAQKKLQALIAKLPKDSKQAGRARVAQAECLIAANKTAEATQLLRQIVKDTKDKTMKAAAYNALGASLFAANQYKEARWEFLWVDVVYNEDRTEHAKALYYLWRIFTNLGEADRAQECLDSLLNERQFVGTEYQQRAKVESAKASS